MTERRKTTAHPALLAQPLLTYALSAIVNAIQTLYCIIVRIYTDERIDETLLAGQTHL